MTEHVWAAGVVDCEGCINIAKFRGNAGKTHHYARVVVAMSLKGMRVMERMRELFGGTIHKLRDADATRAEIHQWRVIGKRALPCLRAILPHLCIKREQCLLAIRLHEECFSDPCSRADIAERIGRLNQRGPQSVPDPFVLNDTAQTALFGTACLSTTAQDGAFDALPTDTLAAWGAAVMDCEGCINVSHDKRIGEHHYRSRLVVGMSVKGLPVMRRLLKLYGGNITRKATTNENQAKEFEWHAHAESAISAMDRIRPHLLLKQEQADLALRLEREHLRKSPAGRAIFDLMKELNRTGPAGSQRPPRPSPATKPHAEQKLLPWAS